ncbi:GGDEF domain-containing protein [Trujillonella endophytica]|uniref:Diguanylate cyclase, GGDEF domain n=1 Tax=Trujillonella endophytica TaxID=673521 RepID=A0A1H8QMC7_9ACTN|nr:GGDEF domain-containing protein [Trujillella endophytica]SEO55158.1 Diguanylate cyclase, GGDEF domain [Trujillella endophytica]
MGTPASAAAVLRVDRVDADLLTAAAVAHAVAVVLSFLLPWRRWSAWALLAFPVFSTASVALVATAVPGVSGVFGGFFALCFAYAGLFLPRGGSYVLLPPALVAYFGTLPAVGGTALVRAVFLAGAWLILGELLGLLRRRHEALFRELRVQNETDALTGLANRRGMERFLGAAEGGDILIVFDLDDFKRLNDSRGHAEGDRALETFGRLLSGELRTRDRAARSGGEELLVLLRCSSEPRCGVALTRRLRRSLETAYPGLTFSAGIAVVDPDLSVDSAVQAADRAMYAAKAGGRDQVWVVDDERAGELRRVADFRLPDGVPAP